MNKMCCASKDKTLVIGISVWYPQLAIGFSTLGVGGRRNRK